MYDGDGRDRKVRGREKEEEKEKGEKGEKGEVFDDGELNKNFKQNGALK